MQEVCVAWNRNPIGRRGCCSDRHRHGTVTIKQYSTRPLWLGGGIMHYFFVYSATGRVMFYEASKPT